MSLDELTRERISLELGKAGRSRCEFVQQFYDEDEKLCAEQTTVVELRDLKMLDWK